MQQSELYINDTLLDLPSNHLIALSYAVNTLTDLKSVQGNISNAISLPDTANNRAALGYPNDLNYNGAPIIRKKLSCRYVQNGVDIIPQGNVRILGASKGMLNIVISSGNTDFFDLLTGKLRDLNFSEYDHIWNMSNVITSRLNTDGYIYPWINYGNISNDTNDIHGQGISPNEMRPAVFAKAVVAKIVAAAGYKLNDTALLADPFTAPIYQNLLLPFSSDKLIHPQRYLDQYLRNDIEVKTYDIPDTSGNNGHVFPIDFADKVHDANNLYQNAMWTAPALMTVNIGVIFPYIRVHRTGGGSNVHGAYFKIYIRPADGSGDRILTQHSDIDYNTSDDHLGEWYNVSMAVTGLAVNPNDKIYVAWEPSGNYVTTHINANATLSIKLSGDNVLFGEQMQIEGALPDMASVDFLKFISFLFCAIIQTDNINKTVTIVPFGYINQNLPNAVDWSDKVTNAPDDFDVQIGDYAQQNEAKFNQDDAVTPSTYANGSFTITDQNLDHYKNIYDIPFAASLETKVMGDHRTTIIKKITDYNAIDANGLAFTIATKQRILLLNKQNVNVNYRWSDTFTPITNSIPFTYFASADGSPDLTMTSIFKNHYKDLINLLNDQRKLTCYLRLNETDIQNLDFFKPIYISKYQCYFYLSKITDFTGVKPCKVELIKLF